MWTNFANTYWWHWFEYVDEREHDLLSVSPLNGSLNDCLLCRTLRPILYCGGLEGLEIIRLSWCHQNAYGSGHHTGVFVFTDSVHAPPKKMNKNMIVAAHRKTWKRANIKMHLSLHTMFGWCGQIARHTTKFVIPLGGCKKQNIKILATSTYIPHFFVF